MNKTLFAMLLACAVSTAHEGHDTPGALPPAPHGGVVKEAEHKVAHAAGQPEDELFFEVVYKNGELQVYPLILSPSNTTTFTALSPEQLSKLDVKVEYPRTKKTDTIITTAGDGALKSKLDVKGANRFIVHVSSVHNKETKVAKIQIEKR